MRIGVYVFVVNVVVPYGCGLTQISDITVSIQPHGLCIPTVF